METLSILVVDDDPVMRRLLQQRLEDENFRVVVADDGHRAEQILRSQHFDVVLTDLVMPGELGGIEVLDLTKRLSPDTEVVLITGHSSVDTAVAAMKKGAADYLEKPINFDELFLRMDKIANLKSLVRSARDIEQAMSVTEAEAASTIQTLETAVVQLRETMARVRHVLQDDGLSQSERIAVALGLLAK